MVADGQKNPLTPRMALFGTAAPSLGCAAAPQRNDRQQEPLGVGGGIMRGER